MSTAYDLRALAQACRRIGWQMLMVVPVGLLAGTASAFFIWALDEITQCRWQHGWLLFGLPLAGVVMAWMYSRWGRQAEGGNNLILENIHTEGGGVPARMTPLILGSTLLTHLCGGSAGREGTAVQMGGSLASAYARVAKITGANLRLLLMAGVAAGFGSVFGTPVAGAIFAMEVLVVGRFAYAATLPLLAASFIGHATCLLWGTKHTVYRIQTAGTAGLDLWLLAKVAVAAVAFGLAGRLFVETHHGLQRVFARVTARAWLRPVIGAALVIGLVNALGTRDFLGLGATGQTPDAVSILSCFSVDGATTWSWLWKLLFTAITLASGFKGGEVTPLFFVGAALGNALGVALGAPVDLMAGLGFIALLAATANTPLACTVVGIEFFGGAHVPEYALACFVAYYFSGHAGIYGAQRIGASKLPWRVGDGSKMSEIRVLQKR